MTKKDRQARWVESKKQDRIRRAGAVLATDPNNIRALGETGGISKRAANALVHLYGVERLDQLTEATEAQIARLPTIGKKTAAEVRQAMETRGLKLKEETDSDPPHWPPPRFPY